MSFPYFDLVMNAYNELIAEGKIKPSSDSNELDMQKGLMTQRAGYYSNLRNSNIGVLEKTSGTSYKGYSVDILIHKDGHFWDIGTDNGHMVSPVDGETQLGIDLIPRWRQPTKELAGLDGGGGGTTNEHAEIIEKLNSIQEFVTINEQYLQKIAEILQTILKETPRPFSITYPNYIGKVLGFVATLTPDPRKNPNE